MNRDRFEGNWKQFTGRMKERWGRLTHDLECEVAGRRDQLAGRIQEQYGISKEEAVRQLKDFLSRNRDWDLVNRKDNRVTPASKSPDAPIPSASRPPSLQRQGATPFLARGAVPPEGGGVVWLRGKLNK